VLTERPQDMQLRSAAGVVHRVRSSTYKLGGLDKYPYHWTLCAIALWLSEEIRTEVLANWSYLDEYPAEDDPQPNADTPTCLMCLAREAGQL
jgi:hypothetical protein